MGEGALGEVFRKITDTMFFTEPGRIFSYSNPSYSIAFNRMTTGYQVVPGQPNIAKPAAPPAGAKATFFIVRHASDKAQYLMAGSRALARKP